MAKTQNLIIGFISIVLLASGIITLSMNNLSMTIDKDKTTFKSNISNTWIITGVEYNSLLKYGTIVSTSGSTKTISTHIDQKTGEIRVIRTVKYYKGPTVIDYYLYDGNNDNIQMFPVSHSIRIINGSGYTYQYQVKKLNYKGKTKYNLISPQKFGYNMSIMWDEQADYSKLSTGTFTLQFKIINQTSFFNARLFDPPTDDLFIIEHNKPRMNLTHWITNTTK